MKPGDLIRIYDPDEIKIDGQSYSAVGILVSIQRKTPNKHAYRIFRIFSEGRILIFDEPYWAAEIMNST